MSIANFDQDEQQNTSTAMNTCMWSYLYEAFAIVQYAHIHMKMLIMWLTLMLMSNNCKYTIMLTFFTQYSYLSRPVHTSFVYALVYTLPLATAKHVHLNNS